MTKALLQSIALAAALAVGAGTASAATATPNKTTQVRFAKGATQATYRGKLRGTQVHAYRFYARQGQVLNVDWGKSARFIDVAVLERNGAAGSQNLTPEGQVLPRTGTYEVRVMQTSEGARLNPKKWRPYALTVRIANEGSAPVASDTQAAAPGAWLNYRCTNGQQVQARYTFGEATSSVQVRKPDGTLTTMDYSPQSNQEQMVFKGQGYTWSVDQARPGRPGVRNGFLFRNTSSVVNGQSVPVDQIVVKNCDLVR